MRWYHFTAFEEFTEILQDEALLPEYGKLRRRISQKRGIDKKKANALLEAMVERMKRNEPNNYARNSNVWLTPDNSHAVGVTGNDIVLGFELPYQPNDGRFLKLPEASLEHLVDVGATPAFLSRARELLSTAHDGKYSKIQTYTI